MNDNFILYKKIKEFSYTIIKYLDNIPRKNLYIEEGLQDSFIECVRLIKYYVININESRRIKTKYLKDLLVEISVIDYYLELLYNLGVLGGNLFNKYTKDLEDIIKLIYGVIRNEKE